MTTASALLEVFRTVRPKSKKNVELFLEETMQENLFMKSMERGLREVKEIETGRKKGKTLKEILNGN